MRPFHGLVLALAACGDAGGGGKDDTDAGTDTDPAVDSDEVVVYEPIEPSVQWLRSEFNGVKFVTYIPDNPAAMLVMYHGTGGSGAGLVDTTEMTWVINELLAADIGFLAVDAIDQSDDLFDTSSDPADNADWLLTVAMRDQIVAQGGITADTPVFTLGFSAGGAFASYVGHAAKDADWPIKGILLHNAAGWSDGFGDPPRLPVMWMCAEHDDRVPMDSCDRRYQDHVDAGRVGVWAPHFEIPLYPTRFVRTTYFTVAESQHVFDEGVRGGFFDEAGQRLFPADQIDAKVTEFTRDYDVIYPKPVTAQLNVVLGAHAVNGEHGAEEAQFILDHRAD